MKLIDATMILFAVAMLADVLTTVYALRHGSRELNPIMAWSMRVFGPVWWWPKLALAIAAWMSIYRLPVWALWMLVGLSVLMLAVAVNNIRTIPKEKP